MGKAKVAELKLQATKGGAIQLRQVNVLQSKLASFAESDEVKQLILGMLKDLETREDILDKSLADTKSELESQTLDGDKINAGENYDNEHAEFVIVAPPADRSIFILQV